MLRFRWLLCVVLAGAPVPATAQAQTAAPALSCAAGGSSSVEGVLRAVVGGEPVPAGFSLTYTEARPPQGSLRLSVHADGTVEQRAVGEPARPPGQVTPWEWRKLAARLVLGKLWQQRTPAPDKAAPDKAAPDAGRTTLTLRCGDHVSEVWEWTDELVGNGRLIRVGEALREVAGTP